jgi:uncharacterized protein YneF (UPF0154 family)
MYTLLIMYVVNVFLCIQIGIFGPYIRSAKIKHTKIYHTPKITAKIEHFLNIFLYLYSLVCTFLSYFFPK